MQALDLFCGAGGASMGLHKAGFEVTGVDTKPQPEYPFKFMLEDAFNPSLNLHEFDLIWASPSCQQFTTINVWKRKYPDLITETRAMLVKSGKPYVIENVPGSPLINPLMLCGTMFGLRVQRHRLFETNPTIIMSPFTCHHHLPVVKHGRRPDREKQFAAVTGHFVDLEYAREAMGIDWMGRSSLAQAIPPAYAEWIGKQIIKLLPEPVKLPDIAKTRKHTVSITVKHSHDILCECVI